MNIIQQKQFHLAFWEMILTRIIDQLNNAKYHNVCVDGVEHKIKNGGTIKVGEQLDGDKFVIKMEFIKPNGKTKYFIQTEMDASVTGDWYDLIAGEKNIGRFDDKMKCTEGLMKFFVATGFKPSADLKQITVYAFHLGEGVVYPLDSLQGMYRDMDAVRNVLIENGVEL